MAYNIKKHLENNIKAVKIALAWQNGAELNPQYIEMLKSYSGFGGIKSILLPEGPLSMWEEMGATESALSLYQSIHNFYNYLRSHLDAVDYKKVIASLKESTSTAFYTPEVIPKAFYTALSQTGVNPQRIYEPSAGSGIFLTQAMAALDGIKSITAIEKDELTGRVLTALSSIFPVKTNIQIGGFEDTPGEEAGKSDLIISNIPFGNFRVYDKEYEKTGFTTRIHNYFFAKGLSKLADGGILAFLTTESVLNTRDNQGIREHLFSKSDFISLSVMPDNLMKDTGNTEAPSHLLIVQKNDHKVGLSPDEELLIQTVQMENSFGKFHLNAYIQKHLDGEIMLGEASEGKNQYGGAHLKLWHKGDLDQLYEPLAERLQRDINTRLDKTRFKAIYEENILGTSPEQKYPTYQGIPPKRQSISTVQLDMFGASAEHLNRAMAYIGTHDQTIVDTKTANPIAIICDQQDLDKEAIVVVTARTLKGKQFVFRIYSNIEEIAFPAQWMNEQTFAKAIDALRDTLAPYLPTLQYDGDKDLENTLGFYLAEEIKISGELPDYKPGTLIIYQDQIGLLEFQGKNEKIFKPLNNQANLDFYKRYVSLRDGYLALSVMELAGHSADDEFRVSVNNSYEDFYNHHGLLNSSRNRKLIQADQFYCFTILASVERRQGEGYIKADILTTSIVPKMEVYRTDSATDALARCLNDMGKLDIAFMESATGKRFAELREELQGHIYLNPVTLNWETADAYLSGNVVEKLQQAEAEALKHPDDPAIARSVNALKEVQPELIPFEVLDFNLGERWIPTDYYQNYAKYLFETDTQVTYLPSTDSFKVNPSQRNSKIMLDYVVIPKSGYRMYGQTLFEHALVNTSPYFTYKVGRGENAVRKPDNAAIQLAFEKIEQIRSGFKAWLSALPDEEKLKIERLYNEKFNCRRLRTYDGSHLQFPGFVPEAVIDGGKLYASQRDATWRILQNRGGLIDHGVGMGKTIIMILSAMEMKRLGIANKPMILALKANVRVIAKEFQLAYPKAKILAPTSKDFQKSNRARLFHEIQNNNWDCIIITHDQFGKIPQAPEVMLEIIEAELECLEKDMEELRKDNGKVSKQMLKGLQHRKKNLNAKLKSITADIENKKDLGTDFAQMGIDHLFIDESHSFKNLTYTTRHNRVAGLSNPIGVQKALNLLFAIRSLQKKFNSDLCSTFLSGTIISNSLTELYIIFKYLRPQALKQQHIENFDSWAAVFAEKTTEFEFSVTNEIKAKERFRTFIKIPELGRFLNEICDYKTSNDIQLDKPELIEKLIAIPPCPQELEFSAKLMEFARTGDATLLGREQLTSNEDIGRMLMATNYAKKMAVDMRLIDPDAYSDHPDNKVNVCARNVAEIYRKTAEHLGTQVIFCDIGIPGPGFNIYDALKEKLINDFDIPAAEITFIHDWKDEQRNELYDQLNKGEIRILISSRSKGGVGTNYQRRMIAGHGIDVPWRPSDLEQANGRFARTKNMVAKMFYGNKVESFLYAKERSLDTYKFNLLKAKQLFIAQLKNSNLNIRRIDEGGYDDQTGMAYTEYVAQLSGNTTLLERAKLERVISVLESSRMIHMRQTASARLNLSTYEGQKASATAMLVKIDKDLNHYQYQLTYQKDGTKNNPVKIDKFPSTDAAEIGTYLIDQYKNWNKGIQEELSEKIGSLFGFELYINRSFGTVPNNLTGYDKVWENSYQLKSRESGITYTSSRGIPNTDNPKLAARIFLNAIDKVHNLKTTYEKQLEESSNNIRTLQALVNQPFEGEEKLVKLKTELLALDQVIKAEINDKKMDNVDENDPVEIAEKPEQSVKHEAGPEKGLVSHETADHSVRQRSGKKLCPKRL